MRTTCCISTISYNSVDFLKKILIDLQEQRKIVFWCFIKHIGETFDDGSKEKDHIHLFIEPHGPFDTLDFQRLTEEYDPDHPMDPLRCIFMVKSDWPNWLVYDLHDPIYLRLKMQEREYQYCYDDFYYSSKDEFEVRYSQALHSSVISEMLRLPKLLEKNSVPELVAMGFIPPEKAHQYKCYDQLLQAGKESLSHKRSHD